MWFPDTPCMKRVYRDRGVGPLVSSQERRAAIVPLISRWSSAGLVPPPLYIGFRLFVLLRRRLGHLCSIPWRIRGTDVSWANRSVDVPSCPAPPRRPAVFNRPDPNGPWYVRVLDSTDLMSCRVLSCPVMSCRVMSRHVMSCHVKSNNVVSCHVISRTSLA